MALWICMAVDSSTVCVCVCVTASLVHYLETLFMNIAEDYVTASKANSNCRTGEKRLCIYVVCTCLLSKNVHIYESKKMNGYKSFLTYEEHRCV